MNGFDDETETKIMSFSHVQITSNTLRRIRRDVHSVVEARRIDNNSENTAAEPFAVETRVDFNLMKFIL